MKRKELRKVKSFWIFLLIVVGFVVFLYSFSKPDNVGDQTTARVSSNLKFTVDATNDFEEADTGIIFTLKNNEGEITVIRNGTQFGNLESYLKNLDSGPGYNVQDVDSMKINNLDTVSRVESTSNNKYKIYYIFVNNAVYNLSTSSESLYDDLDRIAQSFRYTGD